jgi:EAL domain-containing protein (putative c-di-GMP-specific phosphodiesterase class I)
MTPETIRPSTPLRGQRRVRAQIGRGLEAGEFALLYQPRVDLVAGTAPSCEALLRWPRHPTAELGASIPNELGAWLLGQACVAARGWSGRGVSVKVSREQLATFALGDQVAAALAASGLAPERLELGFSESTLIDCGLETVLRLSALRDLGVGLALDDFGAGWTSIALLRRLPLSAIKLDRSLIHALSTREGFGILRAVVDAGRALGLTVVADGIETELQRACLASFGCDQGQGDLFGSPLRPELVGAALAYFDDTCPAPPPASQTIHGTTSIH